MPLCLRAYRRACLPVWLPLCRRAGLLACLLLGSSAGALAAVPPAPSNPEVSPEAALGGVFHGAVSGEASVSAGGNAFYSVPLQLPPGLRGIAPQLALQYNSNLRNGLLGLGWHLAGASSKVTRCASNLAQDNKVRAVDYTPADRFCLDGHKLLAVSGSYGASNTTYRTEIDQFAAIQSRQGTSDGPRYFVVKTKAGLIKTYGATDDSRIEAQGSSKIRVWALTRVKDAAGNHYDFQYTETNARGEVTLSRITYAGNVTQGLATRVALDFSYQSRSDNPLTYELGSQIRPHPKRLARIDIRVAGALKRKYALRYEEIGVDKRSRLIRVDHCDAQNNCQQPLTLEWLHDGAVSYTDQTLTVPYFAPSSSTYNSAAARIGKAYGVPRWHDMNGDGRPDYVYPVPDSRGRYYRDLSTMTFKIKLSQRTGGYQLVTWQAKVSGHPKDFVWADMDGDGRTDILFQGSYTPSNPCAVGIAFARDNGFETQRWQTGSTGELCDIYDRKTYADMNGDKRPDRVRIEATRKVNCGAYCTNQTYHSVHVQLNLGNRFGTERSWLTDRRTAPSSFRRILDINGDSLADFAADRRGFLNRGDALATLNTWLGPDASDRGYVDVNRDGLPDRVGLRTDGSCCSLSLNTGRTQVASGAIDQVPVADVDDSGYPDAVVRNATASETTVSLYLARDHLGSAYTQRSWQFPKHMDFFQQWSDLNGDGILDYTIADTYHCHTNTAEKVYCESNTLRVKMSQVKPNHLLKQVTTGLGVQTVFTFKPLTDSSVYSKGTTARFPAQDVQDATYVAASLKRSNGNGGTTEVKYSYRELRRDLHGRGNLGFGRITAQNLQTNTTTVTRYAQTFPYSSQPILSDVRRSSDNRLLSRTATTYGVHGTVGEGPVFPYVDTRVVTTYNLNDGRLLATATAEHTVDDHGNLTEQTTTTLDHETNGSYRARTLSTFTVDDSWINWRVGQLRARRVEFAKNGARDASLDTYTRYRYAAATGFLVESVREPTAGAGIQRINTLAYDAYGNVTKETVSGPGLPARSTILAYDTRRQFPISITNALGHRVRKTWDSATGQPLSETDANGQTTQWSYDNFGAATLARRPDGTTSRSQRYRYTSGSHPTAAFYTETRVTGAAPVREFYDRLGRVVRSRRQSFQGYYVNTDTTYDARGRANRHSEPYFEGDSIPWNTSSFDHLNRVTRLQAADPVNASSASYNGFVVAATDAAGRTTRTTHDALGRVIDVQQPTGARLAMVYDAAGNRTKATQAPGTAQASSVSYRYNRLGQLLRQDDPDHGRYNYTYDALGQTLTEISPRLAATNQRIRYQYDLLGRLKSRQEPEGTTSWTYDNTTGGNLGLGRLHRETRADFRRTYAYQAGNYGRPTGTTTVIASQTYQTRLSYDTKGRVDKETYPASPGAAGGFTVQYRYNAAGYLERVQAPGGGKTYYQLVASDAAGRPLSEWRGDGSLTTQSYAGVSGRLSDQFTVNKTSQTLQHFSYGYDAAGNMTRRRDPLHGVTETFTFDGLDRLTTAKVGSASPVTYGFDVVGNLTKKSDLGNPYAYTSAAVHAVTRVTTAANARLNYSYDGNGNFTQGSRLPQVTWSSYNKPTQLVQDNISYSFDYGPDRQRYRKLHKGVSTHYIGNGFEKTHRPGATQYRHIIRANGRAVMVRTDQAGSIRHDYLHRDHLGSVTAVTRESDGSVIERYSYDAWGKRRHPTRWTPKTITNPYESRGYTGHEHLDDIGIIHMNGRIYSAALGRMLSPDPVTKLPNNSQNYNRYSYAANNPLKFTDPSGYLEVVEVIGKGPTRGNMGNIWAIQFASGRTAAADGRFEGASRPGRTKTGDQTGEDGDAEEEEEVVGDVDIQTAGNIDCRATPDNCTAAQQTQLECKGMCHGIPGLGNRSSFSEQQTAALLSGVLSGTGAVITGVGCAGTGTTCGLAILLIADAARQLGKAATGNDPLMTFATAYGATDQQADNIALGTDFVTAAVSINAAYRGLLMNSVRPFSTGVIGATSFDTFSTLNTVQQLNTAVEGQ